jgi:hypothetical protein
MKILYYTYRVIIHYFSKMHYLITISTDELLKIIDYMSSWLVKINIYNF